MFSTEVFQRRKKYNTPVYQVRHPGLANYVGMIIKAVKAELYKATVERVILAISEETDSTPLERFVFHLDYLIPVPLPRDRDLMIDNAPSLHELELFLRAFMMKLMLVESSLQALPHPDNTSFAILMEFKPGQGPSSDDKNEPAEGPWVPSEQQPSGQQTGSTEESNKAKLLPIRTLDSGVINMMLHVEDDTSAKSAARATYSSSFSSSQPDEDRRRNRDEQDGAEGPSSPRFGDRDDGSITGFGMSDDGEGDWR
ncbi:hypothetical protein OC861_003534 [Tilletia horrida]|nr:hypothetical protein OC845_000969 [Tilletia horrida]KAK0565873.1 hypothetical protein OC861_003534 [Tilletia horrida]